MRKRDSSGPLMRRFVSLRAAEVAAEGEYLRVSVVASTEAAVDFGKFREVLLHGEGNVDTSAAVSVLYNHDRNQVIGRIVKVELVDRELRAELLIRRDAKTANGVAIADLVEAGDLDGISVGYAYDGTGATYDRATKTVTVRAWILREISFTPVQADVDAHLARALSHYRTQALRAVSQKGRTMDPELEAIIAQYPEKYRDLCISLWGDGADAARVAEGVSQAIQRDLDAAGGDDGGGDDANRADDEEDDDDENGEDDEGRGAPAGGQRSRGGRRQAPPVDHTRNESQRAARMAMERDLYMVANSHGVTDVDFSQVRSFDEGLRAITRRRAEDRQTESNLHVGRCVRVTGDAVDRVRAAATDGIRHLAGLTAADDQDLGLRIGSGRRLIEEFARTTGAWQSDWTDKDLCRFALGTIKAERVGGANNTTSMFSTLLADSMNKLVMEGFLNSGTTYRLWTSARPVRDYKAFTDLALSLGYLAETKENAPYLEMGRVVTSGGSQVVKNGGTITLTEEVIVNDDLGEWLKAIMSIGIIADQTRERNCVVALAGYDYSTNGNIKATAGALSEANLGPVRAVMRGLSVTTNKSETVLISGIPRLLLVPATLYPTAYTIVNPGPAAQTAQPYISSMTAVEIPHLEDTSISGYSVDDYYIAEDPRLGRGVRFAHLQDRTSPELEEFDAGAVDARNWKLKDPHKAYMASKFGVVKADKA